jgi:hypothetical protein
MKPPSGSLMLSWAFSGSALRKDPSLAAVSGGGTRIVAPA